MIAINKKDLVCSKFDMSKHSNENEIRKMNIEQTKKHETISLSKH